MMGRGTQSRFGLDLSQSVTLVLDVWWFVITINTPLSPLPFSSCWGRTVHSLLQHELPAESLYHALYYNIK